MASLAVSSFGTAKVPRAAEVESRNGQIRATIYGQCIGDAIGLLTEFMTKEEAKRYYKEKDLEYNLKVQDFHRSRWETGDWTDDSDQMLLIMLSLLDRGGQVSVQGFAEKMKNWMFKGFAELGDFGGMGIGRTTHAVLRHPTFLTDPHSVAYEAWDSSGRDIAPNGGVMRTSLVGTHCWWDIDRVVTTALEFVRCTHYDQRCQASAVAVSVCISLMLQRQPQHMDQKGRYNVDALIKDSFSHAAKCLEKQKDKQLLWQYMSCKKIKELNLAEPGKIGYTYKSMGTGFWALKKDNFRKAIQKIAREGGDADSNACVAGAMLGCKLGLDNIPDTWRNGLKHRDWLDQHIDRWLSLQKEMASQTPVTEPGGDASLQKEPGGDASLQKEAGEDASLQKEAGEDASLQKEAGGDASLQKEAGEDASLQKEAGEDASLQKEAGEDASLQKEAGGDASLQKEAGKQASLQKDPGGDASLQKEAGEDASLQKEAGGDASLQKEPGEDASLQKDPGGDASLQKEAGGDASLQKEAGKQASLQAE